MTTGNAKPSPAVRYYSVFKRRERDQIIPHASHEQAWDMIHRRRRLEWGGPAYLLVVKPKASVAVPA